MQTFLAIVGLIISGASMVLVAWVWYTKLFASSWSMLSGEHYPAKMEGETCGSFAKRMAPRGLVQLLLSTLTVLGLVIFGPAPAVPLFLTLAFFLPVIGTRVLWMKEKTSSQKWALLGLDVGYILVALYLALGVFTLWGELVLRPLVQL